MQQDSLALALLGNTDHAPPFPHLCHVRQSLAEGERGRGGATWLGLEFRQGRRGTGVGVRVTWLGYPHSYPPPRPP